LKLQARELKAEKWTGNNLAAMRKLLGDNVARLGDYVAAIQFREDGTAKPVIAKPGEWIVVDDEGVVYVKAEETLREQYRVQD